VLKLALLSFAFKNIEGLEAHDDSNQNISGPAISEWRRPHATTTGTGIAIITTID
jgi:hypothetical protein